MVDPYGRAIRDHHRETRSEPLIQRDGAHTADHPIESLYFDPVDLTEPGSRWLADRVDGPLLDVGAGAGRHALAFQERVETVAVDVSKHLVSVMRSRGVENAREGDLFELPFIFPESRFETVILLGTQSNLVGSRAGLAGLLTDLDAITTGEATVVLDSYDPTMEGTADLLGHRPDATPGLAFRVMHFEYEGDVGPTLLFRLFSPGVLESVVADTSWSLAGTSRPTDDPFYFRAALEK